MSSFRNNIALRLACVYAVFGGLWILASDRFLAAFIADPQVLTRLQTYKGWFFVLASAALIYLLLHVELKKRRRAELEIIKSEEQNRVFSELTSDFVYISCVGPDGRPALEWISESVRRTTGYSPGEIAALGDMALVIHPEDRPVYEKDFQRLAAGETVVRELRILSKEGKVRWVRSYNRPVRDSGQDRIVRIYGAAQSVTERKLAEEETSQRVAELEAVNRISIALRSAHTIDEMLPCLLDDTLAVLGSEAGAIWHYDPSDGALHQKVTRGFFSQLVEGPLKPGEGIAGAVFKTGENYLSREFASDPLIHGSVRDQIPAGWGGACVLIRSIQEVVGVLFIALRSPRQLTPAELHLLATLSEIAGNAIHRSSLHEQTQRRLEKISALHAIDNAITASLDLDFVLDIFLGQVTRQLNVDAAAVLLFNPHALSLEYAAGQGFRSQPLKRTRLSLSQELARRVILERKVIHIPDLRISPDTIIRAHLLEEEKFKAYFGVPLTAKGRIIGVLEVFHRSPLKPDAEWLEFLETLAGQAAIAIENASLFENLQNSNYQLSMAYDTTLEGWSRALELRDRETQGHTERVVELTMRMGCALGLSEDDLINLRRGALLHDIGKMGIPDAILLKRGPLTEAEWEVMRLHPVYAFQLLSPITYLHPAMDIPYCHHEKWDGGDASGRPGYPQGLRGVEIPLAARIFSLVDVWDALRSDRPYRPAWPAEKVVDYIRYQSGKHFDPELVEPFLEIVKS